MVYHSENKILWVDDEEYILSTVQRLLRGKFNLDTISDPTKVLKLLEENKYAVIISDQKMPKLTGIDLLKKIKMRYPQITRLMVTGFLDSQIVEEAVNIAGVFRFITKPWDEDELLLDISRAMEHHQQLSEQQELTLQVREQNKKLTRLNENLESIVFERTKIIAEAKKEVENKNSKIKNLISFIQELNRAEDFDELLRYFKKEFHSKFNIASPFLFYESENKLTTLMYFQKNEIIEKTIEKPFAYNLSIHKASREEKEHLAQIIGRPIHQILSVPLLKFKTDATVPFLFLEHNLNENAYEQFLDYLTERLQVIGLATDRSLMVRKSRYDTHRWEQTFDSIEDPIAIIDIDNNILRMNQVFDKFSKSLSEEERDLIKNCARLRTPQKGQIKKNNKIFEVHTYPIIFSLDDRPTNFVNYYVDVTTKRELYSKMIQNEKMVALGLMAGNIAHELNNPLTGIRSITQVLVKEGDIDEKLISDLHEIDKAALRCQKIIADLLDFTQTTKKKKDEIKIFSINDVVGKTLPLLKTAMRNYNLQIELDKRDPKVLMAPHQLQQVVFNLINNACQAMSETGRLEIKTKSDKDWSIISVSDSGMGIEESQINKIFEPFFTTKLEGDGTGLGLSVCKSIVEKAGGKISVHSILKKGTTFEVHLPRQE